MRLSKRSISLVLIFVLLLPLTSAMSISQKAQAQAKASQTEPNGYSIFLPAIFRVGYNYMPFVSAPPAVPVASNFTQLGPFGGSAVTITADPNHENVFYAGTMDAGIFKSTDYGATWLWSSHGLKFLTLDSFTIDPTNSNILYAGTHGDGIYKSTDAGQSWSAVNHGIRSDAIVYAVAVNPGNHNLVYAGARDPGAADSSGVTHYLGSLYKSSNGGASWDIVRSSMDDWVYSIAADPRNPQTVLAAYHVEGPYISHNYGDEPWNLASISGGEWNKGRAVAYDPRGTGRAYFSAWHSDFYVSTNAGDNWSPSNDGLNGSHVFPNGIAIKPTSPETIYLADHNGGPGGVMKSTNSGGSWQSAGLSGSTVYAVAPSSGANNILVVGTYLDGIYRSTDGGKQWAHSMTGLTNTQVTGVAFPNAQRMLVSTMGGGVQISSDGGLNFSSFNNNLGDNWINLLVMDPAHPYIVYALTNSAGLRRLDYSQGSTWSQVTAPGPALQQAPGGTTPQRSPLLRRERLDDFLELEGEPPAQLPQTEGLIQPTSSVSLLAMIFAPSNPKTVYLGSAGGGVSVSHNGGLNWSAAGLSGATVYHIAVDPFDENHVYAATDQRDVLKVSTDGGQNWSNIAMPAGVSLNTIAAARDGTNRLFAGTSNGLWSYVGDTWVQDGLANLTVTELSASPVRPGWLFAGTSAGVYVAVPDIGQYLLLGETLDTAIQTIAFNPASPNQVYFGTVYRGTLRYDVTPTR